jgi:hypothetical protein
MRYNEKTHETKKAIRRSIISETTRNIDSIARQINEGLVADKDLMVAMINRMLAFLNEFVKPSALKTQEEDKGNVDSEAEDKV